MCVCGGGGGGGGGGEGGGVRHNRGGGCPPLQTQGERILHFPGATTQHMAKVETRAFFLTFSPISVWSPPSRILRSASSAQASITRWYRLALKGLPKRMFSCTWDDGRFVVK